MRRAPQRGWRHGALNGWRRGGLLDLLAVAATLWMVAGRTPVGALGTYALEIARGRQADLPSLTAYFEHRAPLLSSDTRLAPPSQEPPPVGGVPEPWRTAIRTTLAEPPPEIRAQLVSRPGLSPEDAALAWLDEAWTPGDDPEAILAELALGPELRDRAIQRAVAAGDAQPERYDTYRRHLPAHAQRQADPVVQSTLRLVTLLRLRWPVKAPHRISSSFGERLHPILRTRRFHNGVDLAIPVHTPIYAAQTGRVAAVAEDERSGRYLILDHGHGVRTSYSHLEAVLVEVGAQVQAGDPVARSGNTGRSTGPHLHFVVRIGGRTVDPVRFRPNPATL